MMKKLLAAFAAAWIAIGAPAVFAANQAPIQTPTTGPMSASTFTSTYLNPALLAIWSCNWGPSAPANGPGAAPGLYECWANSTTNPTVFSLYDGASWVAFGKLDVSAHTWTPVRQGTDLGTASTATTGTSGHTLGFLDGTNTVSGAWNLGTPSAVVLTNGTGLPIGTGISGLGTGCATWLATPSSANLRACLTDEVGTGAAYFVGGALGTPASGTATNLTGLPLTTGVTGVLPSANGGTGVNNSFNLTLGGTMSTAGALTHAGAFATTITATATTNSTLPAGTHTLAGLDVAQSWTGVQTFADGQMLVGGSTSGTLQLRAAASAGTSVIRFPAGSIDFTATGGSAQYVKQTSSGGALTVAAILAADLPLVANASGSPSATAGAMKCDGVTITCASGVATASGSSATSITVGTTTVVSGTSPFVLYNNSGTLGNASLGAGLQLSGGVLSSNNSMAANKYQVFGSGSGTITTPTGAAWAKFTLVGGGGGGGGGGTASAGAAGAGVATCLNTSGAACTTPVYSAGGGAGGTWAPSTGGAGGTITGSGTCTTAYVGGVGSTANANGSSGVNLAGANGGNSIFTGGGSGAAPAAVGNTGVANTGGGGQGGGTNTTASNFTGSGGGSGGTCIAFVQSPASSYTYAIGTGGTQGSAGTNGFLGGVGGTGYLIAEFGFN